MDHDLIKVLIEVLQLLAVILKWLPFSKRTCTKKSRHQPTHLPRTNTRPSWGRLFASEALHRVGARLPQRLKSYPHHYVKVVILKLLRRPAGARPKSRLISIASPFATFVFVGSIWLIRRLR